MLTILAINIVALTNILKHIHCSESAYRSGFDEKHSRCHLLIHSKNQKKNVVPKDIYAPFLCSIPLSSQILQTLTDKKKRGGEGS